MVRGHGIWTPLVAGVGALVQYAANPIPAVLEVWVGGLETYGGAPAPICDPAVPQEHPLGPVNPPALWRTSTSSP
jgi:hypothetical protein